jgi:hypothetical protein
LRPFFFLYTIWHWRESRAAAIPSAGVVAVLIVIVVMGVRIFRQAHNYHSLRISDEGIAYWIAAKWRKDVAWDEIAGIVFVRTEAMFPDLHGPYLETYWILKKGSGETVEVMDEWSNRRRLLAAFREFCPEFDTAEARLGLRSRKDGKWNCFWRNGEA